MGSARQKPAAPDRPFDPPLASELLSGLSPRQRELALKDLADLLEIDQQPSDPETVRARVLTRLKGQMPSPGLIAYREMLKELGEERVQKRAFELRQFILEVADEQAHERKQAERIVKA